MDPYWLLGGAEAGTHQLSCQVELTLYTLSPLTGTLVPARKRVKMLKAEFTVAPAGKPDGVILRQSPELDAGVARKVRLEAFEASLAWLGLGQRRLTGWISLAGACPIDLVFEIVARIDEDERSLGFLTMSRKGGVTSVVGHSNPRNYPGSSALLAGRSRVRWQQASLSAQISTRLQETATGRSDAAEQQGGGHEDGGHVGNLGRRAALRRRAGAQDGPGRGRTAYGGR